MFWNNVNDNLDFDSTTRNGIFIKQSLWKQDNWPKDLKIFQS